MADKVNPYRRWLGLAQPQPDFFQLLGIDRSERRPEAIRSAAEARLELLKAFHDEAGKQERRQLADEIRLAYKTLAQPDQREAYLVQLHSTTGPAVPLAVPLAVSLAKPASPPPIQVAQPAVSIPLAAPVKVPEQDLAPADPLAAVAKLGSHTKKKSSRRSKSWLVPIFSLVLFLGGPLVVLAIVWFNSNENLLATADTNSKGAAAKQLGDKANTKPPAPVSSPFKGLLKESAPQGPPGMEQPPRGQLPDSDPDASDESSSEDPVSQPPADRPEGSPPGMTPDSNPPPADISAATNYASPQVADVIRGAWVDLVMRNEEAARRRVTTEKGLLVGPSETPQLAAIESAIGLSEGFWKQVVSSCRMMKTGEIRFGDEVAMFIESTDQFVVLKLKGILVRVQLAYLPKTVAIELAERGKIEDIPLWRLQKSTALLLHPADAVKNEQVILGLLGESARDGHETGQLAWLLQRRIEEAQPTSRRPRPAPEALDVATAQLNEKIPDKQLAQNNVAGRNLVIQKLQALVRDEPDANVRFVALERARKHAIKKADLVVCRQLIERQGAEFAIDLEEVWRESLEEMADYVQSPQQAELVCEAAIAAHGYGWPLFEAGVASEQSLAFAEDLARKHELKMTLDRIRYLTGQK